MAGDGLGDRCAIASQREPSVELVSIDGLQTLNLDLVFTLALAALFLFAGLALQSHIRFLARSNIPAPAIGGLLFALIVLALRTQGNLGVKPDITLRAPLQTAFFTTVGLKATLSLLRAGGRRLAFFWILVSVTGVIQNLVGIAVARLLGVPDAIGIICGALTLTGGPATGMAFADTFERMGIEGAGSLIMASATFGIIVASLLGNPVATALIRRFHLSPGSMPEEDGTPPGPPQGNQGSPLLTGSIVLHNLLALLLIIGVGSLLGSWTTRMGVILPGFIGPMLVASIVRNLDDRHGWFRLDIRAVEILGVVSLALFFVIALMDLKLWQLTGLAVPMLIILAVQVVVTILYAVSITFVLMGRDYEAAVTTTGHIGFGLGITPNAVANMDALTARFGPAPKSFLIVPVVGAFFIDFSNPLIITLFANLVR